MKHAVAIVAGGVAALSMGVLAVLLLPDVLSSLEAFASERGISAYLPGGPGFLLTQLATSFLASSLILTAVLASSARILRLVALLGSIFAIAIFLMDRFWLSIAIVAEVLLYWYYEYTSNRR